MRVRAWVCVVRPAASVACGVERGGQPWRPAAPPGAGGPGGRGAASRDRNALHQSRSGVVVV
eukprot:358760-Chlamydomonas_euryale.AAC.10